MENVIFRDNNKGIIISIENMGNKSSLLIEYILLINNLKHNLICISQLNSKGYRVKFECYTCIMNIPNKNTSLITLKVIILYYFS